MTVAVRPLLSNAFAVLPISRRRQAIRRFVRNRAALVGLILVSFVLACAVFAPLIAPYDPIVGDLRAYIQPPSAQHLFGTDDIGRDIFSRVIYGSQISLKIALAAQAISLGVGLLLGLLAGYYGGVFDAVIMRVVDIILAFPLLIIAITLIAVLGASENNIIAALAFVSWPLIARLTRAQVLVAKATDYVLAARSLGAGDAVLLFRHILPNILTPLIVYVTLGIGSVILSEAALSFIGLGGADQATPSWGKMLTESRAFIRTAWWMPLYPGLAILITVFGFNLLGDGLRDLLDVRE